MGPGGENDLFLPPLHPAHLGALQHILCRQVVALVDERAPEGVWTLNARAGGSEFCGDVDGDEAARGIWISYVFRLCCCGRSSKIRGDGKGEVRTLRL